MNEKLKQIGELIRTQDNRITEAPMFCVQQKRRIVGMDAGYSDKTVWVNSSSGETEESETEPENNNGDWEEFGVFEYWEDEMVSFTEEGCKEYLRLNGHNLKEPRIYAKSFYRCPEMLEIRKFLMSL